jgi:hypothetical protein
MLEWAKIFFLQKKPANIYPIPIREYIIIENTRQIFICMDPPMEYLAEMLDLASARY